MLTYDRCKSYLKKMMKINDEKKAGFLFIIGIVIAIVLGIFSSQIDNIPLNVFITYNLLIKNIVLALLFITGIIVGIFNTNEEHAPRVLLASLAILVVTYIGTSVTSSFGKAILIGPVTSSILESILIVFIPFSIILCLRLVMGESRKRGFIEKIINFTG